LRQRRVSGRLLRPSVGTENSKHGEGTRHGGLIGGGLSGRGDITNVLRFHKPNPKGEGDGKIGEIHTR